jgi:subtilisin family serine protease
MTERYTVLRFSTGSDTGLESYGADALPKARVDVADLSIKDIRDLRRDPTVSAAAPEMPVALVKPVAMPGQAAATTAWGISAIRADQSAYDGRGTVVAVLDTGITRIHPAFAGVNLVERDFTGEGNGDPNGHGTHCAGTIFGRDVNGTRIGVARGITKALIGKVLGAKGAGSSDALFQAIHWALNGGAQVLSMSLSFDFPSLVSKNVASGWPVDLATSRALEAYRQNLRMLDALMMVVNARVAMDGGSVVVAAAGNESKPQYKLSVSIPAAAQGVISVGALNWDANGLSVADFSNTLPEVSAPGVNVLSAEPNGGLIPQSGTSMAAPHVAGIAAMWWQMLRASTPNVRAPNVVAQLLSTARTGGFAPNVNIPDRGAGLITAP